MATPVDFSNNAPIYDRRHGAVLAPDVASALTRSVAPGSRIVDIGAGTGRVSVALAQLRFEMAAIEPSISMLQALQQKCGDLPVRCIAAEGSRIPLRRRAADVAVLARLLYLVADWQTLLREARALIRDGGLLLHEWGNGRADEPWVQIRERARSIFQQAGVKAPFHPGARTEAEVNNCLDDLGFVQLERIGAGSGPSMTIRDFLGRIESGELSHIWEVPTDVRRYAFQSSGDGLRRRSTWIVECVFRKNCIGLYTRKSDRPVQMPQNSNWLIHLMLVHGSQFCFARLVPTSSL